MPTSAHLVRAHHAHVLHVRAVVADRVGRAWAETGGPGDGNIEAFTAVAVPLVQGGQRRVVQLMGAYLGHAAAGGRPVPIDADQVIEGTRRGVSTADVYARPIITMRAALAAGLGFTAALSAASDRATVAAQTDVMLANRAAGVDGMRAAGVTRYERVLSGTACDLCLEAAGETYSSDDLMPIHNNCDCDVSPISEGDSDPAASINDEVATAVEAGPDGEAPATDGVTVEHGELGPILVDAKHHYSEDGDPAE